MAPKTASTHEPSDIGDQYLKLSPASPGVVFHSMCQNRHGLPRSSASSSGATIIGGNAT
jgi:hypothetical protein